MRTIVALTAIATLVSCETPAADGAGPTIVMEEPGQIADPGETVMTVDGRVVGRHETDMVFRRMGLPDDQIEAFTNSQMGYHVLEDYALATALFQRALDQELYKDPDVQLQVAFATRAALSQAMLGQLIEEQLTDAALQEWITSNEQRLNLPQVRARQIVVPKESYADELMQRVQAGEDFAALASDHSTDATTAERGGDMYWFTKGDYPELGDAVFAHTQTKLLGPLESQKGWHVIEVLDRRDATPQDERVLIARAALQQDAALAARNSVRDSMKLEWAQERADPHLPPNHPPAEGGDEGDAAPEGAHP